MPPGPAAAIPDWYRVGWRQNSGIDNIQEGKEKTQTLLATYLDEQFYGDWYHNAAVIVFVRCIRSLQIPFFFAFSSC